MAHGCYFAEQSLSMRRLVRLMQKIAFGRIVFTVHGGNVDFAQKVCTSRTFKCHSGGNDARPEASMTDFELRKEVITMQSQLAKAADGARVTVEIKHGLPFTVEIEEEHKM